MSGRLEHEMYIDKLTYEGLEGYPTLLKDYYEEAAGRQKTSKNVFVNRIKRFCSYLESNGFNVHDNNCWANVTKRMIKDYIKSIKTRTLKDGTVKELKGKSLEDVLMTLDNFFEYLVSEEYIKSNPVPSKREMSGIIPSEMNECKPVSLTVDEINHIKRTILTTRDYPKRDLCLFVLGCRRGLRAQALSEIDIDDIDFKEQIMTVVEKNKKIRTIYLDPDLINIINDCIEERGFVDNTNALFVKTVCGEKRRITKRYIASMLESCTKDIDKYVHPHLLRASCTTNVYNLTHDIYAAARAAGHSNIQNTKRYINTEDRDREIALKLAAMY